MLSKSGLIIALYMQALDLFFVFLRFVFSCSSSGLDLKEKFIFLGFYIPYIEGQATLKFKPSLEV